MEHLNYNFGQTITLSGDIYLILTWILNDVAIYVIHREPSEDPTGNELKAKKILQPEI